MSHGADSLKSIFFALGANIVVAISKYVAAFITGSGSMLAEAIHSTADTGNQILLLVGMKQAKRPPNQNYPLGYGKAIYFWSFIVALMLFSIGGMFSVYEGIHKLDSTDTIEMPIVAITVLIISIFAEGTALWGAYREVRKDLNGRSLLKWFKETRRSELIILLGEDSAAIVGLTFALGAILLTVYTGNPVYDAFGGIMIGVLLIIVAFFVGKEIMSLLIGEGVEPQTEIEMSDFINSLEDVDTLLNIVTLQLGNDVMLSVKVKMQPANSGVALVKMINAAEVLIKKRFPEVLWLFFEPDITDDNE